MKIRFHVAPAWWAYSELSQQPIIEADYAGDAASEYVRLNDANLDYPQRVLVKTLQYNDDNEAVIRQFEVVIGWTRMRQCKNSSEQRGAEINFQRTAMASG